MFWYDGSCIRNHGHIMKMLLCINDNGVFIEDQEYQSKHGYLQNIQFIVKKPYIYLLARCSSDDHQLLYGQERINDILELHGIENTDAMWIFKQSSLSIWKWATKKWGLFLLAMPTVCSTESKYCTCLCLIYHFQIEFLECVLLRHVSKFRKILWNFIAASKNTK